MFNLTFDSIIKALDLTKSNGGTTLWFTPNIIRTFGTVVGNGNQGIKLSLSVKPEPAYILDVAERFFDNGADGIGFWMDNGILYIDPVFYFTPAQRQAAMAQAIVWGELAVYDIASKKVIETTTFVLQEN